MMPNYEGSNSFSALTSLSAPICLPVIIFIPTQAGLRTIRFAQSRNGNDQPQILQSGPVLDRFDQIGPRTLRGPALVGSLSVL